MARNFKYIGPHDAVLLVGFGEVKQGDVVTVENTDQADEFEARDDFQHIPDKQRSRAAKKAAAKKADAKVDPEPAAEPDQQDEGTQSSDDNQEG